MKHCKKQIKRSLIISFSLFFIFCNNKEKQYILDSNDVKDYYVYFLNDSILKLVHRSDSNKVIDSMIFYKNEEKYFQKSYSSFAKELLVLNSQKDTFYTYQSLGSDFYCEILRKENNKFKSSFGNIDSLNFKYRFSFYYDDKFEIDRIESVLNDEVENYYKK